MSVQRAKDFLAHLATDEAASAKARAAHEASLLKVAGELGFAFSADDLSTAMADLDDLGELSAAELQGLAGGRIRRFIDS